MSGLSRTLTRCAGVFAIYAVLAIAFTWPLAARLGSVVPYDLSDPLSFVWILWWNAHASFTDAWLNAPIFYPSTGAILYQDALLGVSPIATPLQWWGASPLAVHNLLVIASFALSAFTAYLLCVRLFRNESAAVIGGLVYGFAIFRVAQIVHLNILLTYWVPLVLLGLHEYFTSRRRAWLILAAAAFAAQGITSGYFLVYGAIVVGLWAVYFLRLDIRRWAEVAAAFVLALAAIWPLLSAYQAVHAAYGFHRSIGDSDAYGADVMALTYAPTGLSVWGKWLGAGGPENQLFPGFVLAAACAAVVLSSRALRPPRWSRTATVFSVIASLFALVAAISAFSPTSIDVAGLKISLTRPYKPLAWVWIALLIALAATPPVRRVWRERTVPGFYALSALVLWILALGPTVKVSGERIWYKAPYSWLFVIPGAESVRVPARLWLIVVLALGVIVAYGLAKLGQRSARAARIATVVVGLAILIEAWPGRLTMPDAPARVAELEARSEDKSQPVLELPLDPFETNQASMYRAMYHGRPLINGASGYFPSSFGYLMSAMRIGDMDALTPLAERTSFDVVVHRQSADGLRLMRALDGLAWPVLADTGGVRIYRAPRQPERQEPAVSAQAAIAHIEHAQRGDVTSLLANPHEAVFLSVAAVDITLAAPCRVDEVQFGLGPGLARLEIKAPGIGASLWKGMVGERGMRAALIDPRHPTLRLRFEPTRLERLTIESELAPGDPEAYITSLAVFGPDCLDPSRLRRQE